MFCILEGLFLGTLRPCYPVQHSRHSGPCPELAPTITCIVFCHHPSYHHIASIILHTQRLYCLIFPYLIHLICIQIYTHALLHIIVVVKYRFLVIFLVFTVSICLPRPRKTNSLDVLPPQDIPDCRESIGIVRLSSLRHSPRHRLCRRLLVRHEN